MEDIIITVLALTLGLGFKVIEKKLKSAGKPAKAGGFKELADLFGEEGAEVFPPVTPSEELQEYQDEPIPPFVAEEKQQVRVPEPELVKPVTVSSAPVEEAPRSVNPVEVPILEEEEPEHKEKIDPKKLIVYSEIMKPKYLE